METSFRCGAIIEAEEGHGLLAAMFKDQANGVVIVDSDGQGVFDGVGQLGKRRRFEQPKDLDESAGSFGFPIILQSAAQNGEALRQLPLFQGPGHVEGARLAFQQGQIVHRIEDHLVLAPMPWMGGDHLIGNENPNLFDAAHGGDMMMGAGRGNGVIVAMKANQGKRVHLSGAHSPNLEPFRGKGQEVGSLFSQEIGLGAGLPAERALQIVATSRFQLHVERLDGIDARDGHQEIAAPKTEQGLDVSLLIRPTDQTEMVREQIVALQAVELVG